MRFVAEEGEKFMESIRGLKRVEVGDLMKDLFFDNVFKIIFGINAYDHIALVDYKNPFANTPVEKCTIKDLLLKRLIGDVFQAQFHPIYAIFPSLMKRGFWRFKTVHQNYKNAFDRI